MTNLSPACVAVAIALLGLNTAAAEDFYPARAWGAFSKGDMNTSSFVFRDMNRNGVYDVGDRPMTYVAVVMTGPDGQTVTRRSNLSGFANFKMSVIGRDRDLINPGRYSFRVAPPPGWSVTTGNGTQEGEYTVLAGAPGDMVAQAPTHPVGLTADLTIGGMASPGATIMAIGPEGRTAEAVADPDGRFMMAATPGAWALTYAAEGANDATTRRVTVRSEPVVLSNAGDAAPATSPQVVDFDHLMMSEAVLEIPSGHGGLGWYNLIAMHQRFGGGPGYINGTLSGEFIAYNSSGHPAAVFSDRPFDLAGVDLAVGWNDAEGETVSIRAWRGDTLAYEDTVRLSAMGPVRFAADYSAVNRIEFSTAHYWQMVMDDFTYAIAP